MLRRRLWNVVALVVIAFLVLGLALLIGFNSSRQRKVDVVAALRQRLGMHLDSKFVDTNGVRLHVVMAGPVNGPAVVLLHGYPEFWYGWHEQLSALARAGFRVVVPDQRGYNTSDKPVGVDAYKLTTLARDISGLIDALGYESVHLAGHDWGGTVAWHLALTRPRQVRKLAIFSMGHPLAFGDLREEVAVRPFLGGWRGFFEWPWFPENLASFADWYVLERALDESSRPGTFSDIEMTYYKSSWQNDGAMRAMIDWYRAAAVYPTPVEGDGMVDTPTLIFWGSRDVFLPPRLAALSAQHCRNARVVELPAAGHWLLHEQPEAIGRQLVDFFSQP